MDLLTRLKTAKIGKGNKKDEEPLVKLPEITYIKDSDLTLTLNRGFTELYREQPANPILFLGKWLKKESKAKELNEKYQEEDKHRVKLIEKAVAQQRIIDQNEKQIKEAKAKEEAHLNELKTYIINCNNFWDNFNHICEELKKNVNATGVYLGVYDFKRKEIIEEDDENGHIHSSNSKVLRYIGWSKDHDFLEGKCLESNQGITYDLILPKVEGDIPTQDNLNPSDNQGDIQQDPNKPIVPIVDPNAIKSKLIEDVINEPKMHFFREPRLGCYLAFDISYKTCMNYTSLLSSILAVKEYQDNKEKQEQRYKEWKEQNEQIEREIEQIKHAGEKKDDSNKEGPVLSEGGEQQQQIEGGEQKIIEQPLSPRQQQLQGQPIQGQSQPQSQQVEANPVVSPVDIQNLQSMIVEWKEEPVKLGEYTKEEKKLIISLDTLGQDRLFTKNETAYINEISTLIRDSIQLLEEKLLEKDRDIRINFEKAELENKALDAYSEEKADTIIQIAINDYINSDEFKEKAITDETLKAIECDCAKARHYASLIFSEGLYNNLLLFDQFEFVEYGKIFQNLFYFARIDPNLINEPKTNKLQWKLAKHHWKDFFPILKDFIIRGPKPEEVKPKFKLNKIKTNLENAIEKKEEVKEYSFSLYQLVEYVLLLIKIRHDDILQRSATVLEKKEEREKIIKQNNEIEIEREKIKEQANNLPLGENNEPIEFNLEEALEKFDLTNPKTEVPPDVDYDLDLDYDFK